MQQNNLKRLCHRLQYEFIAMALLEQALTHRSASINNNERFEFLGDSVLSTVIANALFHQFPQRSEGELSRLRASLVRGEMLTIIAQEIQLGDFLILGQGELKSGGFRRASILADALEAVFAAIYLDSDLTEAEALKLYEDYYAAHPFTHVTSRNIDLKQIVNTNKCFIQVKKHGNKLFIISILDNLLKGASGQAVQNMNLLFGLEETAGLKLKAIGF